MALASGNPNVLPQLLDLDRPSPALDEKVMARLRSPLPHHRPSEDEEFKPKLRRAVARDYKDPNIPEMGQAFLFLEPPLLC